MKFLADECFFIATTRTLRDNEYDITSIFEQGLSGTCDEEIIKLCIQENRLRR